MESWDETKAAAPAGAGAEAPVAEQLLPATLEPTCATLFILF